MWFKNAANDLRKSRRMKFRNEEDGSIIIFSLFMFMLILIVAGLAIDFMRAETLRTRIQSTLDRSVLAAASLTQALNSKDVVIDYFTRADLLEYLNQDSIDVQEGTFAKTVYATANGDVDSYFLRFIGMNKLPAVAAGTAREGYSDIEISLILDVSGSMSWNSSSTGAPKIEALKDAAQEFVYRVMCNPDTTNLFVDPCTVEPDTVSVNLVQYNHQVLAGETLLQQFNITNEHTSSSCVDFTNASYFDTDIDLNATLQRAGHFDPWSYWVKGHWYWGDYGARTAYQNCYVDPLREIIPLSNSWQDLYNRIEQLTAAGNTSIEMGMKWGVALLDPAFNPAVSNLNALPSADPQHIDSAFLDRPKAFTDNTIKKFAIVMTDGVNTTSYSLKDQYYDGMSEFWVSDEDYDNNGTIDEEIVSVYRASQNKYRNPANGQWSNSPFGTNPVQLDYPTLWDRFNVSFYSNDWNNAEAHNWIQYPINQDNEANKNSNLVHICAAAKDETVQIFTIGFETTTASTAVLKKCSSSDAHHFDAQGDDIDEVFAAIARSIQKLRLVN